MNYISFARANLLETTKNKNFIKYYLLLAKNNRRDILKLTSCWRTECTCINDQYVFTFLHANLCSLVFISFRVVTDGTWSLSTSLPPAVRCVVVFVEINHSLRSYTFPKLLDGIGRRVSRLKKSSGPRDRASNDSELPAAALVNHRHIRWCRLVDMNQAADSIRRRPECGRYLRVLGRKGCARAMSAVEAKPDTPPG